MQLHTLHPEELEDLSWISVWSVRKSLVALQWVEGHIIGWLLQGSVYVSVCVSV